MIVSLTSVAQWLCEAIRFLFVISRRKLDFSSARSSPVVMGFAQADDGNVSARIGEPRFARRTIIGSCRNDVPSSGIGDVLVTIARKEAEAES
jgi:hypothetical protein